MPLGLFLRELARQTGKSYVWAEELEGATVSLEVEDVDLIEVLTFVARRLDCDFTGSGDLYFIGDSTSEDRAFGVFRVGRLSRDEVQEVLGAVLTETGEFVALADGVCICADRFSVLSRVADLFARVEGVGRSVWLIQLVLLERVERTEKTRGIDASFDLELAGTFSDVSSATGYAGGARVAFKAETVREGVQVYAKPLFCLLDGGEGSVKRTEIVPIAEFTTTETGAVVTSGFSEVEVGLKCLVKLRESGGDVAAVDYEISLGEIVGYVDGRVPVRTEEELTGAAIVVSGGTYLLGSLQRGRESSGVSGSFALLHSSKVEQSDLEIWLLAARIGGDLVVTGDTE